SNGDVLTQEEYYPYGGTAISAGKSACEVKYKMVRYSGKERDASGLYYYGFRYYQPWLGRWLNPDPAGAVDGLNLFRMVRNNPINFLDKFGLDSELLYWKSFQEAANKYNVIIGLRAPNPLGETLLKEGYPSKNFHVKAKSSISGPTAGFIAAEAKYSKVGNTEKQKNYIDEAIKKGAKTVPLKLSSSRVSELVSSGRMLSIGGGDYRAAYGENTFLFHINADGSVLDEERRAVNVLTNPSEVGSSSSNDNPITADYDLFAIFPKNNQSDNNRPLNVPPRVLRGKWSPTKYPFLTAAAVNLNEQEDKNMGNIHHFGKVIIKFLNEKIREEGYGGGKLVWHNDESGNPFSPGFESGDTPIFFIPGEVKPKQISNRAELMAVYGEFRKKGYKAELSARF
ncbi:RHS repeat-associated core domain-containing protein, partial [Chromobacterium violaceum]|uniref:RHS repeat-associated core domain-containing protein n=1 Tax=Chromobacterium violaceum TaxID=536 RepID=UPI001B46EAB1